MTRKNLTFVFLTLIFIFSLDACYVTTGQGKSMQKQINHLHEQLKSARGYHDIFMQEQEDIDKLQEIIERAAKNLGENTADFALQVDKLKTDLAEMEGKVEELSFHLDQLTKDVKKNKKEQDTKFAKYQSFFGFDKPVDAEKIPAGKEKHWKKADDALHKKGYSLARGLFKEYQKKYPDDPKSDDAQLNIGIAYLEEKSGAKALGELQKVIDNYPGSDRMDAVLYYMGEAFFMIQNCADARTLFKTVIAQFPKSPFKKKSKTKIQKILKAPKSVCPTIK